MYFDGSYYGSPLATTDLSNVPWQGNPSPQTTVNPLDLSLAQPSHGPGHSYGIPPNVVPANYNSVRYSEVENMSQGVPLYNGPPVPLPQSMSQTSGQYPVTNGIHASHFAGPLTPMGQISGEPSIRCQWMSGDGSICGQTVTERTVSTHLAEHGIQNMHRDRIVRCYWSECYIPLKRQGITRHYREVHLGVKRKSTKAHLDLYR